MDIILASNFEAVWKPAVIRNQHSTIALGKTLAQGFVFYLFYTNSQRSPDTTGANGQCTADSMTVTPFENTAPGANRAAVHGFGIARQKLPYVQAFAADDNWTDSGFSGYGNQNVQAGIRPIAIIRSCPIADLRWALESGISARP